MQVIMLLAIAILASSCGLILDGDVKQGKTRQFTKTDSKLMPYVVSFEEHANVQYEEENFKVGDIPINFGDTTDDKYDGVCIKYPDGTKEILLKKSWYERTNETQREVLIFHELGHCRLNRKHNNSNEMAYDNNITVKISVMNSVVPSGYYYANYKDAYLEELFHSKTDTLMAALEATNTSTESEEEDEPSAQGGSSPPEAAHIH